jgi:hypothetical protein
MVLYVSLGDRNVDVLVQGSKNDIKAGITPIYTAGFPAGYHYSVDTGVVRSFSGPIAPIPAWTTSMSFKAGQSGSPIVLANLKVVAMAKGVDADASSIGLIVPARLIPHEYWDSPIKLDPKVAHALTSGGATAMPRIYAEVALEDASGQQRKTIVNLRNQPCEESSSKEFRVTATPGWSIDPESIKVETLSIKGASTRYALSERSPSGFAIAAELSNAGSCVNAFGVLIPGGIPGEFTGEVAYVERPKFPIDRFMTVSVASPYGQVLSRLPNVSRDKVKISVLDADGKLVAIKPTDEELRTVDGFLVLDNQKIGARVLKKL